MDVASSSPPAAPMVDVLQPKLERRVSINPPSDHEDIEPSARPARGVEALSAAWRQLPPPAKLLAWAAALALAAPALRRAADSPLSSPRNYCSSSNGLDQPEADSFTAAARCRIDLRLFDDLRSAIQRHLADPANPQPAVPDAVGRLDA